MKFFRIIAYCFIVAGLLSCTKHTTEAPPDLGYDYYPAKIKSYVIYDVDSIVYQQIPNLDTLKFKFQIKEKFDTLFTDNQGRPTVKIIRYKKIYSQTIPYSQMSWTLQDVWMANKSKTDVEVVEENIRYTKLAFPAKLNGTWNGTAHADTNAVNTYTYTVYDAPSSYGNLSFQKTLTVSQLSSGSVVIVYQNYNEKYARGVGLIYKEITNYNYQDSQGNFIPGHIYEGIHYVMTINFYGIE